MILSSSVGAIKHVMRDVVVHMTKQEQQQLQSGDQQQQQQPAAAAGTVTNMVTDFAK